MGITIGKEIDGYHVQNILGQGGMGVVYLAEDVALSRKVALKVIDPALAQDESFLRRFRAEARALARIDSPYIVRVHALRQTDFGVFIVMEYVDGGTLSDLISKGPMPWSRAAPLIKQMLHAFSHAHGVGVIHRDIKPGNIMLTADGAVKVTDFGLAKLHQQNVDATVTQGISGTLFYMSPEQVKGQRDLDHRTDIYSLGMTIYEMLAGRVPLERNEGEFAVLKRIVEEKPPPPSRYAADLPDDLVRIVMKALEKDPRRRYQSADAMLDDIVAFEEGMADRPGAKTGGTSARKFAGLTERRPLFIGGAAALLVLLVVVSLLGYRTWFSGERPPLLTVTTMPEGALVYVGDRFVGQTPLKDQTIEEGRVAMRLVKDGFVTVDTTLLIEPGRPLALDVRMAEAPDVLPASVTITSIPSDADVWIDGEVVGRTPHTIEHATPGTLSFQLRKEGYEDLVLHEEVMAGEDNMIAATLGLAERRTTGGEGSDDPRRETTGTLTVSADAAGHIEVDGRSVRASEPITLGSGTHTVACGQDPLRVEAIVTVASEISQDLTCHFVSRVNVVTTMADGTSTWASIWINGTNRGLAPSELTLEPGTYRIAVRREGFTVLDEEKELTLKPGFEPQTVQLSFRIAKE